MAAGFPTRWGSPDYLESCAAPKIFIQSTNDQFGPRGELEAMYARFAAPKQLLWIEAADHFFAGGLGELEERVKAATEQLVPPHPVSDKTDTTEII
jgi:predicted alpha/beta-hydrolase family hydrolase